MNSNPILWIQIRFSEFSEFTEFRNPILRIRIRFLDSNSILGLEFNSLDSQKFSRIYRFQNSILKIFNEFSEVIHLSGRRLILWW